MINISKTILILGANGFIGNALVKRLLENPKYKVIGFDKKNDNLIDVMGLNNLFFYQGDIFSSDAWLDSAIQKADIVLPLIAIATPIDYIRCPLKVFELDFEANLKIIRMCNLYKKRIIFPSTSEVYAMCNDKNFNEDTSNFIIGPIKNSRWLYSNIKQLLDRVIWAYGQTEGLQFTIFRPFNWIGPRLDSLEMAKNGSSRAITKMILNLIEGNPIHIVGTGQQRRTFTYIDDGIEALVKIIENKGNLCNQEIINIGNPTNDTSMHGFANLLIEQYQSHQLKKYYPDPAGIALTECSTFYGNGYQDIQHRVPDIAKASHLLDWKPQVTLQTAISKTLDFFLESELHERKAINRQYKKRFLSIPI